MTSSLSLLSVLMPFLTAKARQEPCVITLWSDGGILFTAPTGALDMGLIGVVLSGEPVALALPMLRAWNRMTHSENQTRCYARVGYDLASCGDFNPYASRLAGVPVYGTAVLLVNL